MYLTSKCEKPIYTESRVTGEMIPKKMSTAGKLRFPSFAAACLVALVKVFTASVCSYPSKVGLLWGVMRIL